MKPKAIVVLGDSYSNGDGVSWTTQAPRIMGEEWFAESESLLHKIAWYRINKPSHPLTDMMYLAFFFCSNSNFNLFP